MDRRAFFKAGVAAAAAGAAVSLPRARWNSTAGRAESHRSWLPRARRRSCGTTRRRPPAAPREHRLLHAEDPHVHAQAPDYQLSSGQCVYNLGEYPSREPWEPGEYDEQELDRLQDHGIQLIHVMDEWNDRYGLFGGNKLTAVNPEGFRRFVAMVHQRGIKILAYASSGYFAGHDPDYRKEWSRPGDAIGGWWDLPRCSPASPGWRAYFLPRMLQILEDYELDGLYNDWGYVPNAAKQIKEPAPDEVVAFEETPQYDGAMTDLLYLIYSEIKRRGGIYKVHADFSNQPLTGGLQSTTTSGSVREWTT